MNKSMKAKVLYTKLTECFVALRTKVKIKIKLYVFNWLEKLIMHNACKVISDWAFKLYIVIRRLISSAPNHNYFFLLGISFYEQIISGSIL